MRILTLPVTVVRVPLELGFEVAKRAARLAYGVVAGGEEEAPAQPAARPRPATSGNGRPRETPVAPPPEAPPPEAPPPEAPPPEPAHVSEEPVLVAEVAEEGAEEGAGAEVNVDEPWSGYDQMNASDIEDRLVAEGAETAATVKLYEASRKGRASVLEAATRSMRG